MTAKMPQVLLTTIALMGFFNSSFCEVHVMKISYLTIYFNRTTFSQFTDCLEKKYSQCTVKFHYKRYDWVRAFVNYTKFSLPRNRRSTNAYYSCTTTSTHKVVDSVKYDELKCRFKTLSRCEVFTDTCRSYFAALLWSGSRDYLFSKDIGNCSSSCVGLGNLVLYEKISSKHEIPTFDLSSDHFIVNFENNDYFNNDDTTTLYNIDRDTTTVISSSDKSLTEGFTANNHTVIDTKGKNPTPIDTTSKDTTTIDTTAKYTTPIYTTAKYTTILDTTAKETTTIDTTVKDTTTVTTTVKDTTSISSETQYSTSVSSITLNITNPDIKNENITPSSTRYGTSPNIFYIYTATHVYNTSDAVTHSTQLNRIQQDNRQDSTATIAACATGAVLLAVGLMIGFIIWRRNKRKTTEQEQNQNVEISGQVLTDDTISCNATNVLLNQTENLSCNETNVLLDRTTQFNSNDEFDCTIDSVDNEVHELLITSEDNQL